MQIGSCVKRKAENVWSHRSHTSLSLCHAFVGACYTVWSHGPLWLRLGVSITSISSRSWVTVFSCLRPVKIHKSLLTSGKKSSYRDIVRWVTNLNEDRIRFYILSHTTWPSHQISHLLWQKILPHIVEVKVTVSLKWSLLSPNPIPMDFDFGDHLTRSLEALRLLNRWFIGCGVRLTVVCPDYTSGTCWFCVRHKGCLNCEIIPVWTSGRSLGRLGGWNSEQWSKDVGWWCFSKSVGY